MPNFHTQYYPRTVRGLWFPSGTSKTQQQFKDEADINHLVDRYTRTGSFYDPLQAVRQKPRQPVFTDMVDLPDFQTANNIMADAASRFEHLPVALRMRFNNSPELLLAFLQDSNNHDEAVKLGLIDKPDPAPIAPPVVESKTEEAPQ